MCDVPSTDFLSWRLIQTALTAYGTLVFQTPGKATDMAASWSGASDRSLTEMLAQIVVLVESSALQYRTANHVNQNTVLCLSTLQFVKYFLKNENFDYQ